jgi:hypothetical protein
MVNTLAFMPCVAKDLLSHGGNGTLAGMWRSGRIEARSWFVFASPLGRSAEPHNPKSMLLPFGGFVMSTAALVSAILLIGSL